MHKEANRYLKRSETIKKSRLPESKETIAEYFELLANEDYTSAERVFESVGPFCSPELRQVIAAYSSMIGEYVSSNKGQDANTRITAENIKSTAALDAPDDMLAALRRFMGTIVETDFVKLR